MKKYTRDIKRIKNKFWSVLLAAICLTMVGCGDRWPTNEELADHFFETAEAAGRESSYTKEEIVEKFAKCDNKWKDKNEVSGKTVFHYQMGDRIARFNWVDFGRPDGKKIIMLSK